VFIIVKMTDHLEYTTADDKAVCHQAKSSLYYYAGDEALSKVIDLHFIGYTWKLLASWTNSTSEKEQFRYDCSTSLTVTKGSEADTQWKVSGEYKGLGVEIGGATKTFSTEETTTTTTKTLTGSIDPNTSVYLYQKIYSFNWDVWFILDAWNKNWTVGNWKSSGYADKTGATEIGTFDFLSTNSELSGKSTISCTSQSNIDTPNSYDIKQFQDCTRRCQSYLHERGV